MVKLNAKVRRAINERLADMCRNRLPSIPLSDMLSLLAEHGLKFEECILCGRNSRANLDVTTEAGEEVNSWLCLSWLKGDHDGLIEVVAYMS
jgi:hypothetical protein